MGDDAHVYTDHHNYALGILIAVVAALGFSANGVSTRMLKEIHFSQLQFLFALTSSVLMGIGVLVQHYSTG